MLVVSKVVTSRPSGCCAECSIDGALSRGAPQIVGYSAAMRQVTATSAASVHANRPPTRLLCSCMPRHSALHCDSSAYAANPSVSGPADRRAQGSGREGQPPPGAAWVHGSRQPPQLTMQSGYCQLSYDFSDLLDMSSLECPCRRASSTCRLTCQVRATAVDALLHCQHHVCCATHVCR